MRLSPVLALVALVACSTEPRLSRLPLDAVVVLREGVARWGGVDGCGVFISPTEILTVGHALKNGGQLYLELRDGRRAFAQVMRSLSGSASTASLPSTDVRRDLALLRLLPESAGNPVPEAPAYVDIANVGPPAGEQVTIVGAPQGVAGAIMHAAVSYPRAVPGMVLGVALEPGWSGGPVLYHGELVGLVSRGTTSLSLAVSAGAIQAALPELRR